MIIIVKFWENEGKNRKFNKTCNRSFVSSVWMIWEAKEIPSLVNSINELSFGATLEVIKGLEYIVHQIISTFECSGSWNSNSFLDQIDFWVSFSNPPWVISISSILSFTRWIWSLSKNLAMNPWFQIGITNVKLLMVCFYDHIWGFIDINPY